MALKVVGAGLGRTGTNSLKLALEKLLDGPCYHMYEAARRDPDTPVWERAVRGEAVEWTTFLEDYVASVDWPACAFWEQIQAANPQSFVLLSTRESAHAWWESMQHTIIPRLHQAAVDEPETTRRREMMKALMRERFTADWTEREPAIAAYDRHGAQVRRTVARERLIDWRTGDGWEPICAALALPVPDEPFPHVNTAAEFRSRERGGGTPGGDAGAGEA